MNRVLAVIGLLLLTLAVYSPGLHGDFMFDDAYAVRDNPLIKIDSLSLAQLKQAALALPTNFIQSRPLAMLSFGLNHYAFGHEPYYYKLMNILLHIATGLILLLLTYKLLRWTVLPVALSETRLFWLSFIVAALWLLHPLQVSTVLYIVPRMTILAALFSFLALLSYVHGRGLLIQGRNLGWAWILLAFSGLPLLAFAAKENGLLVPLLLFTIEIFLLRFRTHQRWQQQMLGAIFTLLVVLPALYIIFWGLTHWAEMAATYVSRAFTLEERLLTQARVLWFYLQLSLVPTLQQLGFFHDDILRSTSLFSPITTLFSLIAWVVIPTGLFIVRKQVPLLAFGLAFFLAGQALESSFIALELVFEHRNYLPLYGILLGVIVTVGGGSLYATKPKVLPALAVSLLVFMGLLTELRAYAWGNPVRLYLHEAGNHPDSLRANFKLGTALVDLVEKTQDSEVKAEYYQEAKRLFEHITALDPHYSDGLFGLLVLNLNAGLPVPESWIAELAKRLEFSLFNAQNVTVGQFPFLVQCQMSGACPLSRTDLETIFAAVLRNKTLPRTAEAGIASAYRAYYVHVVHDLDTALRYGKQATAAWPEWVTYRLKLVELHLQRQELEAATAELHQARALDTDGRFASAIGETEQLVAKVQALKAASLAPASGDDAGTSDK